VKPQPPQDYFILPDGPKDFWQWIERIHDDDMMGWFPSYDEGLIPRHKIGDILWVKETWTEWCGIWTKYLYRADKDVLPKVQDETINKFGAKWKPSAHMPKEAARIFLRVTDVRAERLQDITISDCVKSGAIDALYKEPWNEAQIINLYAAFWNEFNAKRGYSWESNPWVWVDDFERCEIIT